MPRPSSMVEQPAVASAPRGEGAQPLSRHRLVPGSNPGGGTTSRKKVTLYGSLIGTVRDVGFRFVIPGSDPGLSTNELMSVLHFSIFVYPEEHALDVEITFQKSQSHADLHASSVFHRK